MKHLLGASLIAMLGLLGSVMAAPDIGDVTVRFCKDPATLTKEVNYEIEPDETLEVCVKFINTSFEDIPVEISFVDGTFTNDTQQHKACQTQGHDKNFAQFAEMLDPEVVLPARSAVEKTFELAYPQEFFGMSQGCVITKLVEEKKHASPNDMFTIEIRRGSFVSVFVNGEINPSVSLLPHPENTTIRHNGHPIASTTSSWWKAPQSSVVVANDGNITQNIDVMRILSPSLGSHIVEELNGRALLPGEELEASGGLDALAWYQKGFVKVSYAVFHEPIFGFESDAITEEMKRVQEIGTQRWIFVRPVEIMIVLLTLFVLLGIMLYLSHRKFHNGAGFREMFVKNGPKGSSPAVIKKKRTTKKTTKSSAKKKASTSKKTNTKTASAKKTSSTTTKSTTRKKATQKKETKTDTKKKSSTASKKPTRKTTAKKTNTTKKKST